MCSLNTYGVPYMAPISPFSTKATRDMFVRSGWKKLARSNVVLQNLNGATTDD
ncbi:MAG: spore germination protein [Oscillospiraceae bacterium]